MIIVYAPQEPRKKRKLWKDLSNILDSHDQLSIVLGDFNEVRSTNERLGSSFCHRGARSFNHFISQAGLCGLPMGGKRFTRKNKDGSKFSKLDRILVSSHVTNKWPNSHLFALPREYSDHCPLILKSTTLDFVTLRIRSSPSSGYRFQKETY